jgi:uncharacterized LabA/DUF88 family protein
MPTAVVIDGAFFLRRFGHSFPELNAESPEDIALGVVALAAFHVAIRVQAAPPWASMPVSGFRPEETAELYRIFFYDCPPLTKRLHRPISKRSLHLGSTDDARLRLAVHRRLHGTRKVAVRLGRLNEQFSAWRPKPDAVKRWLEPGLPFEPRDEDFEIDVVQKGVDMRLGLDVASMAFKRQVDQIILVAADADFVPAAKLARREGIDVVLDPMFANAAPDLLEHVDGVRNCLVMLKSGQTR